MHQRKIINIELFVLPAIVLLDAQLMDIDNHQKHRPARNGEFCKNIFLDFTLISQCRRRAV